VRDKQREETRRRLYHAALEVFARDGVDSCRIEDIAQRAEVSRAAFYFHFPTKEDVLLQLLRESEQPVVDTLEALPASASLDTYFQTLVEGLTHSWQDSPRSTLLLDVFATSLRRLRTLAQDRGAEPMRVAVAARFVRASAAGELSQVVPPEVLADFFLLNVLAAMTSWCLQPMLPLSQMLSGVVALFLTGAQAPPDPGTGP
jgi:AcrR family transcriptional regulator